MASLGLDLTKNLSFFAVPAAYFCALGPHAYAITAAGKTYDNTAPRDFKERLTTATHLNDTTKRKLARAQNASDNAFETLGLFAASVVAANQAGVEPATLNALTWGYVATRVAYNVVYINFGESQNLSWVRTALWQVGALTSVGLFAQAGLKIMNAYVF